MAMVVVVMVAMDEEMLEMVVIAVFSEVVVAVLFVLTLRTVTVGIR